MTVTVPGYSSVNSSPLAIVNLMRRANIFSEGGNTLDDYADRVKQTAADVYGTEITVTGTTMEARAESLLREMHRAGMIIIQEETS